MNATATVAADLQAAALDYAAKGLPVFPCDENKQPMIEGGFHSASKDPDTVRAWWARWPDAMIGMPTGAVTGFWALDIDDPAAFEAACPVELPATRRNDTGKGYHLLFNHDPAAPIRNHQRHPKRGWPFPELPGAETRGDGGYVIVPPSLHPSGRRYQWHDGATVVDAPPSLLAIIQRAGRQPEQPRAEWRVDGADTRYGLAALDDECATIRAAGNGEQECALNEAALKVGALVAGGELTIGNARSGLIAAGLAMPSYNARDAWTPEKIVAKIERGLADGASNPRSAPEREERTGYRETGDPGWQEMPAWGELFEVPSAPDMPVAGKDGAPLPMQWACDIEAQLTGLWLVKKLLPAIAIVVLYGHPGSGKTFLALDFGFHVALGWDWHGRKVKQGLVIYVGAEGLAGIRNRIVAFRKHHEVPADLALPFALVPTAIDLQAPDADTPRLIALIRDAAEQCGYDPALIVIDTLSKTFGAGKENTDDMATYVANCGRIAAEFECCVMPVHHRPKDAESTEPRGHSSLKGGVDTVILVEAGLTKRAIVTKQKDADIGDATLFTLLPVPLGTDEDGEEVSSCVIQPTLVDMNMPANPLARARAKLSDKQKIVLRELGNALQHDSEPVPAGIPDDVLNRETRFSVTTIEAWRTRVLSGLRTATDNNPDTARRTFDRAKERLQGLGIIGVWEGYAWEL